jgi:type II secretory pathway component PulK
LDFPGAGWGEEQIVDVGPAKEEAREEGEGSIVVPACASRLRLVAVVVVVVAIRQRAAVQTEEVAAGIRQIGHDLVELEVHAASRLQEVQPTLARTQEGQRSRVQKGDTAGQAER